MIYVTFLLNSKRFIGDKLHRKFAYCLHFANFLFHFYLFFWKVCLCICDRYITRYILFVYPLMICFDLIFDLYLFGWIFSLKSFIIMLCSISLVNL